MQHLFSPLRLGHLRLSNRLALQALPSGAALPAGFVSGQVVAAYLRRAKSGVGLVVVEPTYVLPPHDHLAPHLGLYADAQVSGFHHCIQAIHSTGAAGLIMLDQPLWTAQLNSAEIAQIGEAFVVAAWRARAAGADGVMLSAADGGVFEQLLSPLRNHRHDDYGGDSSGRLQLLLNAVEGISRWIGPQFIIGVRLNVEEFASGGLTMQDSRMIATRLVSSGVNLIEVGAEMIGDIQVARFPGWCVPLAEAIKNIVDVPVMVGGQLDDSAFADSVIRDGRIDLVAIGERLLTDPDWPARAWSELHQDSD